MEPGAAGLDQLALPLEAVTVSPDEGKSDLPLATFPSGTAAGTLLHEVLERIDFREALASPQTLTDVVLDRLGQYGFRVDLWGEPVLVPGLDAVLRTPLGGPVGALRLGDVDRANRLDELEFHLPVGDTRGTVIATRAMARAMADRTDGVLPDPYRELLRGSVLGSDRLGGFLTGFIDLVLRAPVNGEPRYFVVDYKSNRMRRRAEGLPTSADFTPARIAQEMADHDYFLQYHLYLVALQRHLRQRLGAAYDYDRHIGGAYYLFVRGMTGEAATVGDVAGASPSRGVFFDRPPRATIDALDRALSGELDGALVAGPRGDRMGTMSATGGTA